MASNAQACESALGLVFLPSLPAALKAATSLGVFDVIDGAGKGASLSAIQVASNLPTSNPNAPAMVDRILRLLASFNILTCKVIEREDGQPERLYGLTPTSSFLVNNEDKTSLAPLLLMVQDDVFAAPWMYMKDAILEGGVPFDKEHGMGVFVYPGTDPRFNKVFNEGMKAHSTIVAKEVLKEYKGFEDIEELVDVGGGVGMTLSLIISKYPHIRGTNFDLPHVVAGRSPSYKGSLKHVGGDMFVSVPKADAILMKWILHDWGDEKCIQILENCYKSLPENGKVIVIDSVAPVVPEGNVSSRSIFLADILMFSLTQGGKERTFDEFLALAKRAGFAGIVTVCTVYIYAVMEFYK